MNDQTVNLVKKTVLRRYTGSLNLKFESRFSPIILCKKKFQTTSLHVIENGDFKVPDLELAFDTFSVKTAHGDQK